MDTTCSMQWREGKCIQSCGRKTLRIKPLWRPRHRREDNKIDLKEKGWKGVDWIYLPHDRDQCQAVVNMATILGFYKMLGISWVAKQLSQKGLSSMTLISYFWYGNSYNLYDKIRAFRPYQQSSAATSAQYIGKFHYVSQRKIFQTEQNNISQHTNVHIERCSIKLIFKGKRWQKIKKQRLWENRGFSFTELHKMETMLAEDIEKKHRAVPLLSTWFRLS
jgi:hypothetical protein